MNYDTMPRTETGRVAQDNNLIVRFFYDAILDETATRENGYETYRDVELIEIQCPGNNKVIIVDIVNEIHKKRFPFDYQRFKNDGNGNADMNGFPLREWTMISASQLKQLNSLNVYTVEALAVLLDSICSRYNLYSLKTKAQTWLKQRESDASAAKIAQELEARDAKLRELQEKIDAMSAATEKKVGRPAKE